MHGAPTTGAQDGATAMLADFVTGFPGDRIPEAAIEAARRNIVDTVACMLAGCASEEAEPLGHFLDAAGRGDAIVIGTGRSAPPAVAALVNGTFGHALDYDDVLSIMPAHPSTVILPALFALAPPATSGRALIEAYVIGIEVGARIGIAITNGHYRRGWHATGTLAVFSAVAALGRLLGLTAAEVRTAFGIAASMAGGLQCNFGTMTKPLHAGLAAQNAVNAALLARSGLTAAENALEATSGFFAVYGTAESDVSRVTERLGAPFAVVDPSLSLKKYPCCYALHRAIDALLQLRSELGMSADTVKRVTCRVAPGAMRPLIHKRPKTGLEAKFSMEYTLACGILDGGFGLDAFGDEGPSRPEIVDLLPRVEAIEDPRCLGDETEPSRRSAGTIGFVEVTVEMTDGRSGTVRVDTPSGSPEKPLTFDDLTAKFRDCARLAGFPPDTADAAFTLWSGLPALTDIGAALGALRIQS